MARLQRMIEEDHQFNDAPAQNDGWHKIVHWVQESGQLNPLNPGATAPSNVGGPPITWEQEDVYGVPRAWLREANGFLVHSMVGYTAIHVNGLEMIPNEVVPIVNPPDDSYGHIMYRADAQRVGVGFYWKTGGIVTAYSLSSSSYDTLSSVNIVFGRSQPSGEPTPTYIGGRLGSTGGSWFTNFRILYRYL